MSTRTDMPCYRFEYPRSLIPTDYLEHVVATLPAILAGGLLCFLFDILGGSRWLQIVIERWFGL